MIYIIAGHAGEYRQYLKENDLSPHETVYVHSVDQLRGLEGVEIVKCGNYIHSPVYNNLNASYHIDQAQRKSVVQS